MKSNVWKLVVSLVLPQLAGAIGSLVTPAAISGWYAALKKPVFNPPNWLFGPVWVSLYVMMGIALYLIWKSDETGILLRSALVLFFVQLFLNAIWTLIFFGLRKPGWAFLEIILLWIFIFWTIVRFIKIKPVAGYLLFPYLLWVTFAALLNGSIYFLNRGN